MNDDIKRAADVLNAAIDRLGETERGTDEWVSARAAVADARYDYEEVERNRALSVPVENWGK